MYATALIYSLRIEFSLAMERGTDKDTVSQNRIRKNELREVLLVGVSQPCLGCGVSYKSVLREPLLYVPPSPSLAVLSDPRLTPAL